MTAASFTSIASFLEVLKSAPEPDTAARAGAQARNSQLTKPPGALGRLEEMAIWYASWRGTDRPALEAPQVVVFAGNHGVCAQGVSAFPPEVTAQMVANFQNGGAAVNQLATCFGATMDVVALDLDRPTGDFTQEPAMTEAELVCALEAGWGAVRPEADLLVTGEMGIGNTTPAAAILAALFGHGGALWCGRGTGVDDAGLARKVAAVDAGLSRHEGRAPLEILRCLGGREIAAMAGAMARARVLGIPVLIDGFICTAAAAVLHAISPALLDHACAAHVSAEGAHGKALEIIGKSPILALEMRLGEGSGGALAIGVLKGAVACHSGMATFAEAAVSGG